MLILPGRAVCLLPGRKARAGQRVLHHHDLLQQAARFTGQKLPDQRLFLFVRTADRKPDLVQDRVAGLGGLARPGDAARHQVQHLLLPHQDVLLRLRSVRVKKHGIHVRHFPRDGLEEPDQEVIDLIPIRRFGDPVDQGLAFVHHGLSHDIERNRIQFLNGGLLRLNQLVEQPVDLLVFQRCQPFLDRLFAVEIRHILKPFLQVRRDQKIPAGRRVGLLVAFPHLPVPDTVHDRIDGSRRSFLFHGKERIPVSGRVHQHKQLVSHKASFFRCESVSGSHHKSRQQEAVKRS